MVINRQESRHEWQPLNERIYTTDNSIVYYSTAVKLQWESPVNKVTAYRKKISLSFIAGTGISLYAMMWPTKLLTKWVVSALSLRMKWQECKANHSCVEHHFNSPCSHNGILFVKM